MHNKATSASKFGAAKVSYFIKYGALNSLSLLNSFFVFSVVNSELKKIQISSFDFLSRSDRGEEKRGEAGAKLLL